MKKTLIKVCGITNINDIKYASNIEDIDYLGIIFAKESPRCVDLNLAEKLINACDKKKNIVAVFMNQSKEDVTVDLFEAMFPIPITVRGDHVRVLEKEVN